jgi:hypothetical protein
VPSFTVTAASENVTLDDSGAARASFTVTNTSAQALRGRLLTRPRDRAKAEWFTVAGEAVRDFAPNGAQQVVVEVLVPPGTPPGSYSFRLDAVSEVDPDEDFTEGPSVAFDVAPPPAPPKKKFPWWILAIVGAVVLLAIIGVVIWLLVRDTGTTGTWSSLSLQNGWANYSSANFGPPGLQYTKDQEGFVHLRGALAGGSATDNLVATLPSGFRPPSGAWVAVGESNGSFNPFPENAWIDSSGNIRVLPGTGANNAFVSFEGVEFYAG